MNAPPQTMLDKVWDLHKVATLNDELDLIHIDRCLLHDLSGPASLGDLTKRGLQVHSPSMVFATPDHLVSSDPGVRGANDATRESFISGLREKCAGLELRLFDVDDPRQGIVHVMGPALGLTLPGATAVCGDSHTCTHGGIGAIAWGVGSTELTHVLATQCIIEKRPATLRVNFDGELPDGLSAKDMVLRLISEHGATLGEGYAVEYAGQAVDALSVEGRLTLCNLTVEMGAKVGFVAPDSKTIDYLRGAEFAPSGEEFDRAAEHWLSLRSDRAAEFDREIHLDVSNLEPQVSWGINPAHTLGISESIPDPSMAPDADTSDAWRKAIDYMGLEIGQSIEGIEIDQVFIGSCANSRLSDLQAAASIVKGRRVSDAVRAWVVPGSQAVKREAEDTGLARVFIDAGFEWREPGCSLCPAANGDTVDPKARCVSTSNRNFMGRQGDLARTHLASPATAAAAALTGRLHDPRLFQGGS